MLDEYATKREMIVLLPRLRRFALGLTGSVADADDLVQATCERAIRSLEGFAKGTRLDSWMFRIMQNLFKNNLRDTEVRARYARERALTGEIGAEPAIDGSLAMEARLELRRARDLLADMDDEQRAAMVLIAVEGYSYDEASRIMGVPVGTVTSRLARARERMRLAFAESERGEGE